VLPVRVLVLPGEVGALLHHHPAVRLPDRSDNRQRGDAVPDVTAGLGDSADSWWYGFIQQDGECRYWEDSIIIDTQGWDWVVNYTSHQGLSSGLENSWNQHQEEWTNSAVDKREGESDPGHWHHQAVESRIKHERNWIFSFSNYHFWPTHNLYLGQYGIQNTKDAEWINRIFIGTWKHLYK